MRPARRDDEEKRVSRVLFVMVISLGAQSLGTGHVVASVTALDFWPRRATVFVGQFGDCCREDCPFHSARQSPAALVTVALAMAEATAPIWTVDGRTRLPGFHRAPRSVQLGLSSGPRASDHPSSRHRSRWCRLACQSTARTSDGAG